jgi:hypothetical protein
MQANAGDRIVIRNHYAGGPDRECEVLEVRGEDGAPPYLVRWEDTGHQAILYPGSDSFVQHLDHTQA